MNEHLQILLQIYYRPIQAFSQVLDCGSFLFAAAFALAGNVLFEAARAAAAPPLPAELAANPFYPDPGAMTLSGSIEYLLPMLVLFVPVCAALSALTEGLGSPSVILRRDFMPLAVCNLMAWGAAFVPLGIIALAVANGIPDPVIAATYVTALRVMALVVFATFAGCAVRVTSGASVMHAIGIVFAGSIALWVGSGVAYLVGSLFFSPFLLFWIWMFWRPDVSGFTGGLQSRQRFQQNLEASTINPRDADAHYQLGLIYQERRNYDEAIQRFTRAMEIDPEEPDPLYQLGRIAQEQGRLDDARGFYERVMSLDEKHSSSEVWRDLGAVKLAQGQQAAALADLEKYVDRRPYDPEGQYWFGEALRQTGRAAEAKSAYQAAIEAGRTAPRHLRTKARKWVSQAQGGLRSLG